MKKLIYGGLFLALVGIGAVGCKKDELNTLNRNSNKTISFDNEEELRNKLEKLQAMSEDGRRDYEKQNNSISLLTKGYMAYEEINMEKLTNKADLYNHVENNQDLLEITKNLNGELEYRLIYSDNPYSIIASENRMIIVGEKCIKVFEDGIVTAPIEMFNDLLSINSKFTNNVSNKEGFEILKNNFNEVSTKATCDNNPEREVTNGKNKTRLRIGNGFAKVNTSNGETWATLGWIEVRPYKKTLGIWYYARRTISGNITATIGYDNNSPQSHTINRTILPSLSYVQTISHYTPVTGYPSNVHFKNYSAWGTTPSTGNATLNCN